jgi:hypothetical protein
LEGGDFVCVSLEFNKAEMVKMVSAYLENTISDLEIANWADEIDTLLMVKAKLLDLDKVPYFQFLIVISQLRDDERWRDVQRDDIIHILDVLLGKVDESHTMRFQVPIAFPVPGVRDAFGNLRPDAVYLETIKKVLESKLKGNELTDDDVLMMQEFNSSKPIVTILDIISSQIQAEIEILTLGMGRFGSVRNRILYPTDLMRDEKIFISRLIRLIDCYLGYNYFNIFCLFRSGIPYISLLL